MGPLEAADQAMLEYAPDKYRKDGEHVVKIHHTETGTTRKSFSMGESYLIFAIRDVEAASRELQGWITYRPDDVRAKELLEVARHLHTRLVALCDDRKIPSMATVQCTCTYDDQGKRVSICSKCVTRSHVAAMKE
jgi:hypothetical protein